MAKAIQLVAPSVWAPYLINGDASGLETQDKIAADAWIEREGLGLPVSCDDYGFAWHHAAFNECPLGADCQTYTFLV